MLIVPTELRPSPIHGVGVFLLMPVKKGELIWRFDSRIDRVYSQIEVESLPETARRYIEKYAVWHEGSGLYMLCGDHGCCINHEDNPTTLSLGIGFADDVAIRDLAANTELTADYRTICDISRTTGVL